MNDLQVGVNLFDSQCGMRFAATFLIGLATAACGVQRPTQLIYYEPYDPRTLDPARATDVASGEMIALLYEGLTRFTPGGDLEPGLASRWKVEADGERYVFHLRSGVTFHNGKPFTARDVVASTLRALDPGRAGTRQWPFFPIRGARAFAEGRTRAPPGISAPNDSTVIFELTEPLAVFPKFLAMPTTAIVPQGADEALSETPVGTGPWRLVEWRHDDYLLFARNQAYWGDPALEDTLRVRIIPEELTRAAEYELGRLTVVEVPYGETDRWLRRRYREIARQPALRVMYVAMNTTRGPLRDPRVRHALNYAVDVYTILQTIARGRGQRAAGAIPPGLLGHDSTQAFFPFDPDHAQQLLAQADYPGGSFSLELWVSQSVTNIRIAEAIQAYLGRIGIDIEIVQRDAASMREAARNGEADLVLTDWWADYPDAENFLYPLFHSSNQGPGGNLAFLDDEALDRLVEEARSELDVAQRAQLYRTANYRVLELAPWIFLWFPEAVWAVHRNVQGWALPLVFNGQRWTSVHLQ